MSGFPQADIDATTLAAARQGQRPAQEVVYRTYGRAVYTLAMRIVQQPEAAEEILQDTFVEVLLKLDSYRGEAPLGAWIRRIAVNKALMYLRSGWHRYARPLEGMLEPSAPAASDDGADLDRVLGRLRPTARAVVWLHDVEGYTHREIAAMMGKTPSFSKSQLARAHRCLRDWLTTDTDRQSCMQLLNNC